MCPTFLPICIPIDMMVFFGFLMAMGFSLKQALVITAVVTIIVSYLSYKVVQRYGPRIYKFIATKCPKCAAVIDKVNDFFSGIKNKVVSLFKKKP